MLKIIVDCMGGDNGAKVIVTAIKNFLKSNKEVEVAAVGKKEELAELENICRIIDARDVVPMTAGALDVLRMKDSSMMVALKTMRDEHYDAIVSCGSTGGFLASATITLKMIPGIKRAALVSAIPCQEKGKFMTLLDCGANNENTAEELVQFALMGRLYAQAVLNNKDPKTYLLSNGSEDEKGSPEVKEANKLLRASNFPNFQGNIEGREAVLDPNVDVVVTGGFAGNCYLKGIEGTAKLMGNLIKSAFSMNLSTKIGYLFAKKGVASIKENMDYKAVGGALLLGINGAVVKAHGNSDEKSFYSAMMLAKKIGESKAVEKIKEGVESGNIK
ncbi:Phosphate acyltransferase [bioreactor metagenome]|uniref:phosphate acyltransferase n=1 Tax=bioreactor metagenome TaxID=1076179 RepID=A0A645DR30_9ZZZZ|nr:phosphate acyltransferase PlsX [Erysipelotrichaceae bacterium]